MRMTTVGRGDYARLFAIAFMCLSRKGALDSVLFRSSRDGFPDLLRREREIDGLNAERREGK